MAIETVERGEVQTKLFEESREERLVQLFELDMKIHEMEERKSQLKSQHNALGNEIKAKIKDKIHVMNLINSGKETYIPVATSTETDEADDLDDLPTDEELEEYADAPPTEAESIMEEIEGMFQEDFAPAETEELPQEEEPSDEPVDEVSDADAENPFTNIPENIPEEGSEVLDEVAEEKPAAKADSWALFDEAGTTGYGYRIGKKEPTKGGIYSLPPGLRQGDKRYFQVQDYKLNADAKLWEVYCSFLSDAEKKENDAQALPEQPEEVSA